MKLKHQDVARFEVSMHGEVLEECFKTSSLRKLDFSAAYRAFRGIICAFPSMVAMPLLEQRLNLAHLIAIIDSEGFRIGSKTALELYSMKRSQKQVKRLHDDVAGFRFTVDTINLEQMFPESGPPEPVHLFPNPKKERRTTPSEETDQGTHSEPLTGGTEFVAIQSTDGNNAKS